MSAPIIPKIGGRARKTRKMNTWAKAAGEYYREHKNEVNSFSDVLKSKDFKAFYNKKYKNKKGGFIENGVENGKDPIGVVMPVSSNTVDTDPIPPADNMDGGKKKSRKSAKKSKKARKSKKRFFGLM